MLGDCKKSRGQGAGRVSWMLLCLLFTVGAGLHLLDQTWWFGSASQHGTQHLQR